jgi:F0F1-type ATP synthase assembly protein I
MDSPTTPKKKTSPAPGDKKDPITTAELQSNFLSTAVTMGWQLAVAVVIPIVGGYELDQYLHKAAIWEIIGFIIAGLGFYGVLKYTLAELNTSTNRKGPKS